MRKPPKHPSQPDDLNRRNDMGSSPRSRSATHKSRPASKRKGETVPDHLSTEMPSGVMESAEGNTPSSIPPPQDAALAGARNLTAEGILSGEDQQGPQSESRDEAKQQVQTIAFADGLAPKEPDQSVASPLSQPSEAVEMRTDQKQESTQPHPMVHEVRSRSHEARETISPVYILAAIGLGIPALLLIPLVGMNPGVQEGTLTIIVTFLVVAAFVTAAVFEIKRLADQSPDDNHL
jgi:hypothetical protein